MVGGKREGIVLNVNNWNLDGGLSVSLSNWHAVDNSQ